MKKIICFIIALGLCAGCNQDKIKYFQSQLDDKNGEIKKLEEKLDHCEAEKTKLSNTLKKYKASYEIAKDEKYRRLKKARSENVNKLGDEDADPSWDNEYWTQIPHVYNSDFLIKRMSNSSGLKIDFEARQLFDLYFDMDISSANLADEGTYIILEPNLSEIASECKEVDKIQKLSKVKRKVWYIHRKLIDQSSDWYRNRSYYPLVHLMRSKTVLSKLLTENIRDLLNKNFKNSLGKSSAYYLFVDELLNYHNIIMGVDGWEDKFRELIKQAENKNLVNPYHFHTIGFPKHENKCMNMSFATDGDYTAGYDHGLESWFYGFWLRRLEEGNMEMVHDSLVMLHDLFSTK